MVHLTMTIKPASEKFAGPLSFHFLFISLSSISSMELAITKGFQSFVYVARLSCYWAFGSMLYGASCIFSQCILTSLFFCLHDFSHAILPVIQAIGKKSWKHRKKFIVSILLFRDKAEFPEHASQIPYVLSRFLNLIIINSYRFKQEKRTNNIVEESACFRKVVSKARFP